MLMWEPVLEVLENISDDGTDGEKNYSIWIDRKNGVISIYVHIASDD
jgi:hypothetical protein